MKKNYALLLAVAVSVSAMAFRTSPQVETKAEVTHIRTAEQAAFKQQVANINETMRSSLVLEFTRAVAAVTRAFPNAPSQNITCEYKAMLKDIDMRSLDKNK